MQSEALREQEDSFFYFPVGELESSGESELFVGGLPSVFGGPSILSVGKVVSVLRLVGLGVVVRADEFCLVIVDEPLGPEVSLAPVVCGSEVMDEVRGEVGEGAGDGEGFGVWETSGSFDVCPAAETSRLGHAYADLHSAWFSGLLEFPVYMLRVTFY
ncbi:hypothetical protein TWF703_007184 [Orbilia oligospora]|uniref:Uncharacterized protein n=1 Tax=Orbilia oligospora TaxID=2813651 RepID=A0A7C8NWW8_ORBOL|nr:hypothetical protein TWF703_007184 [Orbilia oligospora]